MSAYLDIILLLTVAVVILLRLRSVLGTRPDDQSEIKIIQMHEINNEKKGHEASFDEQKYDNDVQFEALSSTEKVLAAIPGFSKADFCRRCAQAFEMVLKAFSSADENTLKMLVGKKLLGKFKEVIKQRRDEGISAETDLIRIEDVCIEKAEISSKGVAHIVVKFISEQINLIKNAAGEVIEGDENFVQKITDIWTFERDITAGSPAWFLISTKKENA